MKTTPRSPATTKRDSAIAAFCGALTAGVNAPFERWSAQLTDEYSTALTLLNSAVFCGALYLLLSKIISALLSPTTTDAPASEEIRKE